MSIGKMIHLAREGNAAAVKELLDEGIPADGSIGGGRTALHEAASHGRVDVARLLIERGATIDPRDADGQTPLHCSSLDFRGAVAMTLIAAGADIEARDDKGRTPLLMSALFCLEFQHATEGLVALLEAGADPRVVGSDGKSALDVADSPEAKSLIVRYVERAEMADAARGPEAEDPAKTEGRRRRL